MWEVGGDIEGQGNRSTIGFTRRAGGSTRYVNRRIPSKVGLACYCLDSFTCQTRYLPRSILVDYYCVTLCKVAPPIGHLGRQWRIYLERYTYEKGSRPVGRALPIKLPGPFS